MLNGDSRMPERTARQGYPMSNTGRYSTRFTDDESIEALLRTLADSDCRRILRSLQQTSMSASELVEDCGIARSTVYRKLDSLEQAELVSTRIRLSKTGTHTTEYNLNLQALRVEPSSNGIELIIRYSDEDSQASKQRPLPRPNSSSS